MKCLSILQPYAHLIMLPQSHPMHKRVENREWFTRYRGPLLIHAGKSDRYLSLDDVSLRDTSYDIPFYEMNFGAILGVAELIAVIDYDLQIVPRVDLACQYDGQTIDLSWMPDHKHTEGSQCWVLHNRRKFLKPIAYRGLQQLFNVPDDLVAEALKTAQVLET